MIDLNKQQQGSVLVIAMVMLLIISMLAISMGRQELLQRRIVSGQRDYQKAFMNANSTLWEVEAYINENAYTTSLLDPEDSSAVVREEYTDSNWWKNEDNWNSSVADNMVTDVYDNSGNKIGSYVIENAGTDSSVMMGVTTTARQFFRITVAAEGQAGEATAYLRIYYAIVSD